jgi:hypothetical protein
MATNLHNARLNFVYRLELISPTYSKVSRGFRVVDRIKLGGDPAERGSFGNESGRARDFVVKRMGSGPDIDPSRLGTREALHEYEITIAYPTAVGLEPDIHEMMDTDRHDIDAALRSSTTFTGIVGNTSAASGITTRIRQGDQLDDDGDVWLQVYRYACRVREIV